MEITNINDKLALVRTEEGIILEWFTATDDVFDLFLVGFSTETLSHLSKALGKLNVEWQNNDSSLLITGNRILTLHFRMQCPPFKTLKLELDDDDSKSFRDKIGSIAKHNKHTNSKN